MNNKKDTDFNHYHGTAQIICDKLYGYFLHRVDGGVKVKLGEELNLLLHFCVSSSTIIQKALNNEA